MPKREATPPPGDDEPTYYTVVNPFPRGANMELPGDVNRFVQWLAAAMDGGDHLLALFHKPSSRGSIIIEVSKYYGEPRRLLGRHDWNGSNGILVKPEVGHSDIFYCFYTTGRQVEKHGWKRKDIKDSWFGHEEIREKIRRNVFKDPYPRTSFVQVSSSDPTSLDLCRNLPTALFTEDDEVLKPIQTATATVGSSAWNSLKTIQQPAWGVKPSAAPVTAPVAAPVDVPVAAAEEATKTEDNDSNNLWAEEEDTSKQLVSDLALMSIGNTKKGNCPYHGTTCSKGICDWRAEDEKKRGPKVEGPSNTKNYFRNSARGGKGRGWGQISTNTPSKDAGALGSSVSSPSPASSTPAVSPLQPPNAPVRASTVKPVTRAPPPPSGIIRGTPSTSSRGRGRGRA